MDAGASRGLAYYLRPAMQGEEPVLNIRRVFDAFANVRVEDIEAFMHMFARDLPTARLMGYGMPRDEYHGNLPVTVLMAVLSNTGYDNFNRIYRCIEMVLDIAPGLLNICNSFYGLPLVRALIIEYCCGPFEKSLFRLMMGKKADPNIPEPTGQNAEHGNGYALSTAISQHQLDYAIMLLDAKADPNERPSRFALEVVEGNPVRFCERHSIVGYAMESQFDLDFFLHLLSKGADPDFYQDRENQAIQEVETQGSILFSFISLPGKIKDNILEMKLIFLVCFGAKVTGEFVAGESVFSGLMDFIRSPACKGKHGDGFKLLSWVIEAASYMDKGQLPPSILESEMVFEGMSRKMLLPGVTRKWYKRLPEGSSVPTLQSIILDMLIGNAIEERRLIWKRNTRQSNPGSDSE